MPTAAKLFGAIAFAAIAFFAANAVVPYLPEGSSLGRFIPVSTLIGALCGWFVMGRLSGRGFQASFGSGVRTSLTLVFWCLVVFSLDKMVHESTRLRFDGPMDAIVGAFGYGLEFGQLLVAPDVMAILILGGMLGGAFVEWATRRWS